MSTQKTLQTWQLRPMPQFFFALQIIKRYRFYLPRRKTRRKLLWKHLFMQKFKKSNVLPVFLFIFSFISFQWWLISLRETSFWTSSFRTHAKRNWAARTNVPFAVRISRARTWRRCKQWLQRLQKLSSKPRQHLETVATPGSPSDIWKR